MTDEPEVSETVEVDGLDILRKMGAPLDVLDSVAALISDGKAITAEVSTGSPASVAILVDGAPVATFNKGIEMSTEVEGNAAIAEDPRLEHAPTSQVAAGTVRTFIGQRQLVQLLLARGFKIPVPMKRKFSVEELEQAERDGELPEDLQSASEIMVFDPTSLGCEIFLKGVPFDGVLEVRYPEA